MKYSSAATKATATLINTTTGKTYEVATTDREEILYALGADLVDLRTVSGSEQQNLAIGIGVLGKPFRLFHITSAADDAVILHENDICLFSGLGDRLGHFL